MTNSTPMSPQDQGRGPAEPAALTASADGSRPTLTGSAGTPASTARSATETPGSDKPEELDIPVHPWAPSILARRDGVVTAAEVAKAAEAISWNANADDHGFIDWPADRDDAIAIVMKVLEALGLKPEQPA